MLQRRAQVEELKLQSISEDKNIQQLLLTLKQLKTQQRLKVTKNFTGSYEGNRSTSFDTISEYDAFTYKLIQLGISYRTKILKRKNIPTQYIVILLDKEET